MNIQKTDKSIHYNGRKFAWLDLLTGIAVTSPAWMTAERRETPSRQHKGQE